MFQLLLLVAALQRPASPTDEFRAIQAFQCDYGGGAGHIFEPTAPEEGAEERVLTSPPLMYNEVRGLTFDSIDYRSLRARSVTKDRPEAVTVSVIAGDRLVSFLEVSPQGVPIITSILRTPRPLDPINPRTPTSYFSVRSYQLLLSERGDAAYQIDGFCKALPIAVAPSNR
jgi:hypothetical protein